MESPNIPAKRFTDDMRKAGTDTETRDFTVPFDFDNDYLTFHTTKIVGESARIAKALKAATIQVTGYRATTWLANGQKFIETETIAEKRAKKVGEILRGLGLPATAVSVTWKSEPETCDGVSDAQKRRVTINLKP